MMRNLRMVVEAFPNEKFWIVLIMRKMGNIKYIPFKE
jgi:hypothetical protein